MTSQSDKILSTNPNDKSRAEVESELRYKQQTLASLKRKSFIMSEISKSPDPEDRRFESEIEALNRSREEADRLRRIAQNKNFRDPSFWTYLFSRNIDFLTITLMELNLLLVTYSLQTIKTRIQAKHFQEDVSYFLKNKVKDQPVYQGISQALLAVFFGNTISINTFRYIQLRLKESGQNYTNSPFKHFTHNLLAHTTGDVASLPFRIFFDAKKQFLQLNHTQYDFWQVMKACRVGFLPILIRDLIFRTTFNCVNHAFLYSKYYLYRLKRPEVVDITSYETKMTSDRRVGSLLFSTLIAALISNPFDVVAVKIMTQQYPKYTGMLHCFKTVAKEETTKKLWLSGFAARTAFFAINGYIVLNYYHPFKAMVEEAYTIA